MQTLNPTLTNFNPILTPRRHPIPRFSAFSTYCIFVLTSRSYHFVYSGGQLSDDTDTRPESTDAHSDEHSSTQSLDQRPPPCSLLYALHTYTDHTKVVHLRQGYVHTRTIHAR